jgi:hypothetical protein
LHAISKLLSTPIIDNVLQKISIAVIFVEVFGSDLNPKAADIVDLFGKLCFAWEIWLLDAKLIPNLVLAIESELKAINQQHFKNFDPILEQIVVHFISSLFVRTVANQGWCCQKDNCGSFIRTINSSFTRGPTKIHEFAKEK